ncbi:MAG: dihydrodipicolinate synthase family protein [Synoicihabitans sp.]
MNTMSLGGILPVIPTPYGDDGDVDDASFERVVEFCIQAGAGALVYPGVASEYDFLSATELQSLTSKVCDMARGRLPVVSGGGKGTPVEIAANIRHAQAAGAVAAMVLIPRQFAEDVPGAISFFTEIIAGAPGMDIVLQNAPAPVGAGLSPDGVMQIANASTAIRYVKEEALPSGPRITALREAAPEHLRGVIGGGGARYVIDEMKRGALGAMPAAEITDIHVKMWNAFHAGDESMARELYMRSLPLLVIQTIYRMRLTKRVFMMRGLLKNDRTRAPLPEFDRYDLDELAYQVSSLEEYFSDAVIEEVAT